MCGALFGLFPLLYEGLEMGLREHPSCTIVFELTLKDAFKHAWVM